MAIKRSSKVQTNFSMASMTDIVFLLLIFFLVTTTLINPNALKMLLPKSTSEVSDKPVTTISIRDMGNNTYEYYVGTKLMPFDQIEPTLQHDLEGQTDPVISLYANPSVPVEQVVAIMNIAKRNHYKILLATNPE